MKHLQRKLISQTITFLSCIIFIVGPYSFYCSGSEVSRESCGFFLFFNYELLLIDLICDFYTLAFLWKLKKPESP